MSYDLSVYGTRRLDVGELTTLVASMADLELDDACGDEVKVLSDGGYSFTVFGPDDVDSAELPDAVAGTQPRPAVAWQLVVEGSDPDQFGTAQSFARALAAASGGVVYDEQTAAILD